VTRAKIVPLFTPVNTWPSSGMRKIHIDPNDPGQRGMATKIIEWYVVPFSEKHLIGK
jgi:hypothetical protein